MCRSDNTKTINHRDLRYEGDFRTFRFFAAKSDPKGEKRSTRQERHTYANPFMPEICPMLADGLYLLLVGAPFGPKVFSEAVVKQLRDL